jgi:hypothetical protein
VALAAAFASPAGADPSNAANSTSLEVVCGAETITTVSNGNAIFARLHDLNSSSVFTPLALDVTLTFTPTDGGQPSVDHAIVGKNAPIPDGSTTIAGALSGFWTPRARVACGLVCGPLARCCRARRVPVVPEAAPPPPNAGQR